MRTVSGLHRRIGPVLGCVAALLCGQAAAQDRGAAFGGVKVGSDSGAFVGAVVAMPGARLGSGWAVRAIVSGNEYSYARDDGRVNADQLRGEVAAVRQTSGAWGYFNVAVAARYVDTDLSPADPGNPRQGGKWDAAVAVDGMRNADPWRVTYFTSYGFDSEDYYLRGDVQRAVSPVLRLGVEAGFEGDPAYSRKKIGAVAVLAPTSRWEMRLSAGYADSKRKDGAFAGVEFSRTF